MGTSRRFVALLALVIAIAATEPCGAVEFKGGLLLPPRPAADFTLTRADGREFRLRDQRGSVVAMSFGYTFCPDVCPTTLAELAQVRDRLGEAGTRLRIVFVTVDPERDTPARLREYARGFRDAFIPLTGPPDRLAQVRKAYGAVAEKRVVPGTSATYLVDHSAAVYLIDPRGRLRLALPFGTSIDDMTHDIRLLLEGR
jgi:protein SCO1/2